MKICYTEKRFKPESLQTIQTANEILEDYAAQGYDLTLRQLYYQFVARDIIPNRDSEYQKLGSVINDARLAGLIDWDHITDRTRNLRSLSHWDSPQEIIENCAQQFRYDKWADQDNYVEVWVEKDALVGVLEVVCQPLDVPYFSCRGYTSQSEMWAASQRLLGKINKGKKVTIIHLGDHDPSGVDMSRDIFDRLHHFLHHHLVDWWMQENKWDLMGHGDDKMVIAQKIVDGVNKQYNGVFDVDRIALTMSQIREYDPPPNPAKITDSRARSYIEEYGEESWELDALEPSTITGLIEGKVKALRNEKKWKAACKRDNVARKALAECAKTWDK